MELVGLAAAHDGVTGVVAARGAHDDIRLFGHDVYNFAFSFVAPLGADKCGDHVCVISLNFSACI